MAYSKFSEIQINGEPIDWDLYRLSSFTPKQGAKLAYRIDPLKTKKSDDVKHIQKELQEYITRLELRLASISPSWTLTDLAIFLGDDAPEGMIDIVSGVATTPIQTRSVKNCKRDADAAIYLSTIPDINVPTVPQIEAALIARDKNLWGKGFYDWNRTQTVWKKKARGRKAQVKP